MEILASVEQLSRQISNLQTELHTNTIINRVILDLLIELRAKVDNEDPIQVKKIVDEILNVRQKQLMDGLSLL